MVDELLKLHPYLLKIVKIYNKNIYGNSNLNLNDLINSTKNHTYTISVI